MAECLDVAVAAQLAVDADQEIAIECGGDAQRIVVGEQQMPLRLHEIGADQEHVAAHERRPDAAQKCVGARGIEVADVRAQEQRQHAAGPKALAPHFLEADFVWRLVGHDTHASERAEHARRRRQRLGGDVDQVQGEARGAAPPRFDERHQLVTVPAAQFADRVALFPVVEDAAALAGVAPLIAKCWPSKKPAEYSGYDAMARNPANGANGVLVHSQPFPMRSSTPHALAPAGWLPAGSGSQLVKSTTLRALPDAAR